MGAVARATAATENNAHAAKTAHPLTMSDWHRRSGRATIELVENAG
jgi:hypothetical protein